MPVSNNPFLPLSRHVLANLVRHNRFTVAILLVECTFVLLSLFRMANVPTFPIYQLVSFIHLSIVPGILTLSLLSDEYWGLPETVANAVSISVVFVMFIGVFVNIFSLLVGVARPLTFVPLMISTVIMNLVLLIAANRTQGIFPKVILNTRHFKMKFVFVVGLPSISIFASILHVYENISFLLITVYCLIALVPLLALRWLNTDCYSSVIFGMSISLLISTSLTFVYLNNAADARMEYTLSETIRTIGFWSPQLELLRPGNIRLMVVQPVYSILMHTDMLVMYKIVSPFLFGFTPLFLYKAYSEFFDTETAFLSVSYFMFVYSYFVVLSQNTRTGTALLYMAGILYAFSVLDRGRLVQKVLIIVYFVGLIGSHYGTSFIVFFGLVGLLLSIAVGRLTGKIKTNPETEFLYITLFLVLLFSHYTFVWPKTLELVRVFKMAYQSVVETIFISSGSRSTVTLTQSWNSLSLQILKILYVISGGTISIGILTWVHSYFQEAVLETKWLGYLGFGAWLYLLLVISFTPVSTRYGIYRIFPIAMIYLSPALVVGAKTTTELLGGYLIKIDTNFHKYAVAAFLIIFLIFNAGVFSATVTHDISTNPTLDKNYTLEEGDNRQLFFLFKRYRSDYDLAPSMWLVKYKAKQKTVYQTSYPHGIMPQFAMKDRVEKKGESVTVRKVSTKTVHSTDGWQKNGGYLFVSEFNERTGLMTVSTPGLIIKFYERIKKVPIQKFGVETNNKVYTSGLSSVYQSSRNDNTTSSTLDD